MRAILGGKEIIMSFFSFVRQENWATLLGGKMAVQESFEEKLSKEIF